jgi:hypothetical protein
MTIVIGFYPEPFVQFAEVAATQLLDPTQYVETVLGAQAEAMPVPLDGGLNGAPDAAPDAEPGATPEAQP